MLRIQKVKTIIEGDAVRTDSNISYTLGLGNRLASWGNNPPSPSGTTARQDGVARYNTAGCLTNMVSDIDGRELNLAWDGKYQLSSVAIGGTNVNYGYNVLGQRVSRKEVSGTTTNIEYYVHDGVNIVADLNEDKELLRSYAYAPGYDNIISMTTYGDSETNTYFYIRNHNNSVVALVDEDGTIAESYTYTAYGEVTVFDSNGNELEKSALGNRYTFQGRELDYTTGLYNFRSRWYDSETGRWLSRDPIGIHGGLNQYVFCDNNPVMFVDPEGTKVYVFYTDFPHLGIIITDPTGKQDYLSYGLSGQGNLGKMLLAYKGLVSESFLSEIGRSKYDYLIELTGMTDEQECELYNLLKEEYNNQERRYNVLFHNCVTFVIDMLYECGYFSQQDFFSFREDPQHPWITYNFLKLYVQGKNED